jgi:hypothetical protein
MYRQIETALGRYSDPAATRSTTFRLRGQAKKIVIGARCLPVSGLPLNACSGRLSRVSDGASTGPAPIVAPDVGARKPLGIEYDQFRTDAWASNIALQQNLAERTGFVLRA